ncbi:MAG: MFS transporter [Alphaproteobacteria bacterium]|nr:MFS transporter [Alphaproteobacteria bacterium]
MQPATRFALLFAAQFMALGAAMPFIPVALAEGGLSPQQVGLVLALGTATRLLAGPLSGRLADSMGLRAVLVVGAALAALTLPLLALVQGVLLLVMVQLLHSAAVAPIIPLSDAAAVAEMRRRPFDYGRVRAWGSITFIAGALLAGQVVGAAGPLGALLVAGAALLLTALVCLGLPDARTPPAARGPLWEPLRHALFRRLLPCSALIQGSHAVYYGFSTLHWTAAGLSPGVIGALWAWGVVAEVALFLFGRRFADRLGLRGLAMLAAGAGVLRWVVTAGTTELAALFAVQTLHAATFGAMHLAAIRVLMLASGPLYAAMGGGAFLVMAGLCGVALLAALRLPAR